MRILSMADAVGYESTLTPSEEGIGSLVDLNNTVVGRTIDDGGGTHGFDDIQQTDRVTELVKARAWRAMMVTSFTAGGATYVLAFASRTPTVKPFGAQDHAYVEVLASFFATHYYQQRWQSTRIGHQLEHDSLTGLWNRSRFRSLGRAAFADGAPAAIAVVDLAGSTRSTNSTVI